MRRCRCDAGEVLLIKMIRVDDFIYELAVCKECGGRMFEVFRKSQRQNELVQKDIRPWEAWSEDSTVSDD